MMTLELFMDLIANGTTSDHEELYALFKGQVFLDASRIIETNGKLLKATPIPSGEFETLIRHVELAKMAECSMLLLDAASKR